MAVSIKYKGKTIATAKNGQTVELDTKDHKFTESLFVKSYGGGSPLPPEISTEEEMTALLKTAEVGSVYKYTGTTGTYENGALYLVKESE